MLTNLTQEEYDSLEEIKRCYGVSHCDRSKIKCFEKLRGNGLIEFERCGASHIYGDALNAWQVSSRGRLECNLFEKQRNKL